MALALSLTLSIAFFGGKALLHQIEMQLGVAFARKQVLYDKERSIHPILRELNLTHKLAQSAPVMHWSLFESDEKAKIEALSALEVFRQETADKSYFIALTLSGGLYFYNGEQSPNSDLPRYRLDTKKQEDLWFYNTLKQEKPCLLNVDYNETMKVAKVWINCVILTPQGPKGVVGTGFDLSYFINQVIDDQEQGISNLFIDTKGAIQAHRDRGMIDFNSISKVEGSQNLLFSLLANQDEKEELKRQMARLQKEPNDSATLVLEINGGQYIVGLAYIPEIGWYNVSLLQVGQWVDQSLFAPIGGLLLVALLLLLGLSFGMIKILILDRLAKLDQGVAQVAKGNYDLVWEKTADDEIGRLSENFAAMTKTIESYTKDLEQKVLERTAELTVANQTKDKFFSIISHDLRGPTGSLAIILNEVVSSPSDIDQEMLSGMQVTTKNLYNLLNQLLDWARSQQGKLELNPVDFDLNKAVSEVMETLKGQANQKGVVLIDQIESGSFAKADLATVATVLRNLVGNSLKFTPSGGKVEIRAKPMDQRVLVTISDNGLGMTEEVRSNLFKVGKNVKSSLGTNKEEGSGLGLILCAEFVARNQGEIGVDSELGKGSQFWFTLPKGEQPTELPERTSWELKPISVLLVEDNPIHQQSSAKALEELGFSYETANNGAEALAWLKRVEFDLVLMDIDMPIMNGVEATRKIHQEIKPSLPIFALSAYNEQEMKEAHPGADFPVHLDKPLEPRALAKAWQACQTGQQ